MNREVNVRFCGTGRVEIPLPDPNSGNLELMRTEKLFDENGNGFARIFSYNKVEKVTPIDYYQFCEIEKSPNLNYPFKKNTQKSI